MSFSCFKGRSHVQLFARQNSNYSLLFVAIFDNTNGYIARKQTLRTEIGIFRRKSPQFWSKFNGVTIKIKSLCCYKPRWYRRQFTRNRKLQLWTARNTLRVTRKGGTHQGQKMLSDPSSCLEIQRCPQKIEISLKRTHSFSYHSLIRHHLLDVSIEESDDNCLAVSTDFFSCTVCKGNETRPVAVDFFYLKEGQ